MMLQQQQLPLVRQLDMVFKEISQELSNMNSGVVFVQIRNNMIGKFGVRHEPLDPESDLAHPGRSKGLSERQQYAFRKMAIQSLRHKQNWTHGEIQFDFMLKKGMLVTSVQLESNYNMANVLQQQKKIHK